MKRFFTSAMFGILFAAWYLTFRGFDALTRSQLPAGFWNPFDFLASGGAGDTDDPRTGVAFTASLILWAFIARFIALRVPHPADRERPSSTRQ